MLTNLMALKYDRELTEKYAVAYEKSTADFRKKSVVTIRKRLKMGENISKLCDNS